MAPIQDVHDAWGLLPRVYCSMPLPRGASRTFGAPYLFRPRRVAFPRPASPLKATRLRCHPLDMPRLSIFDHKPPLSLLTAFQLLDLARELREMALTASTPEMRQSLDRLVVLYVMCAARREIEERRAMRH